MLEMAIASSGYFIGSYATPTPIEDYHRYSKHGKILGGTTSLISSTNGNSRFSHLYLGKKDD